MVEYKKIWLDKIKAFFSYFIKFDKDKLILFKNYFQDCKIVRLNKKLIIMIIYNKKLFWKMMDDKKYKLEIVMMFFDLKAKKRNYNFGVFFFSHNLIFFVYYLKNKIN